MIEWLEEYLQQPGITLFMVTHDRYFLENVCDSIIELEGGELRRYSGSYSDYSKKRPSAKKTRPLLTNDKTSSSKTNSTGYASHPKPVPRKPKRVWTPISTGKKPTIP
jgi:ATPase subunit of ABC transporter with duplicated ATPase domains